MLKLEDGVVSLALRYLVLTIVIGFLVVFGPNTLERVTGIVLFSFATVTAVFRDFGDNTSRLFWSLLFYLFVFFGVLMLCDPLFARLLGAGFFDLLFAIMDRFR